MSDIKLLNRREFLATTALATASAAMPSMAFAQDAIRHRGIPGKNESLPVVGLGGHQVFVTLPEEGKEVPVSVIQTMMDQGGKMIDTPAFFRPHDPVIGEIINEMEVVDDLFLISKITVNGDQANAHLERVVNNLNKRPMDLLLVHNMRDIENNWAVLKQWKDEGKTRYTGVSLTRQQDYTDLENFMKAEKPDFVMTGYSITQQGPAARVLPLAQDLGIAVIGVEPFKAIEDGAFFSAVADHELPDWAAEFDCDSWAQFSLKWIVSNPAITSVVSETSKPKHVIDNMGAGHGRLPDEVMRKRMSNHLLSIMS